MSSTVIKTALIGSLALIMMPTTMVLAQNCQMGQGNNMMQHGCGMNHHMSMDLGPADAEYNLRFIDAMILHHQGAIEMATEALNKAQHTEIKKLAQEIITAQKQEIAQMKAWRKAWYPKAGDIPIAWQSQTNHSMAMTKEQKQMMMMDMDLGQADAKFDLRFIDAMIPHHQGALVMAKDAFSKSQKAQIKQLSQEILTSQQQEIDQMKAWRKAWYSQ